MESLSELFSAYPDVLSSEAAEADFDEAIVGGEGFTVDAVWTEPVPEFEGAPPLFVADVTPQQE